MSSFHLLPRSASFLNSSNPSFSSQRGLELLVRLVDALAGVAVEEPPGRDAEGCFEVFEVFCFRAKRE